jgi:NADH:quinone reductase (non-electrogenic)
MTLRTPISELLGIEYPVVQAGMGPFTAAELVAAVSNAGGLAVSAPRPDPLMISSVNWRVPAN